MTRTQKARFSLLPLLLAGCTAPHDAAPADAATRELVGPGRTPALFAPGVVNTDGVEINLVFDRGYSELFFSRQDERRVFAIYTCRRTDGGWSAPEKLDLFPGNPDAEAVDMTLSTDGTRLYFLGIHPADPRGGETQRDLWVSERTPHGWTVARRVPAPVSTEHSESYPVIGGDGSLWFVSDRPEGKRPRKVYRAQPRANGGFEAPVAIAPPINADWDKGDTAISPDGACMILTSSRDGGHGSADLYISRRTDEGGWTEPKNMGPRFNGPEVEFCPMFSPDGRWFSFSRRYGATWDTTTDAEIYWVDAAALDDL